MFTIINAKMQNFHVNNGFSYKMLTLTPQIFN